MGNINTLIWANSKSFCDGCIEYDVCCKIQFHNKIICPIKSRILLWSKINVLIMTKDEIIKMIRGGSTPLLHELLHCNLPTELNAVVLDELKKRDSYDVHGEMRL